MAYVLSLNGGGMYMTNLRGTFLKWTAFFLLGLPGTLRLIKNSDNKINYINSLLATGSVT